MEEDYRKDEWQTPQKTLEKKSGDCEDIALLLLYLLQQNGYDAEVVFGLTHGKSKRFHAWVELNFKGDVYVMDPTIGFMPKINTLEEQLMKKQ